MRMNTLYTSKHYLVHGNVRSSMLEVIQSGFASQDEHMQVWEFVKNQVVSHRYEGLVIDGAQAKVMQPEVQAWFERTYFPDVSRLMVGRTLRIARLLSDDIFTQFVGQKLEQKMLDTVKNIETQLFRDRTRALAWLRETHA